MNLFLASHASHPTTIQNFEKFMNGFKNKTIAYIPTAANGETPYGTWQQESQTWNLIQTFGAQVTPVVLEEYGNARVLDVLKGKDVIWVAGGMCGYLMYWMRRCQLDIHLKSLLESGTTYFGSSAGSMVCSKTLKLAEVEFTDAEHGASVIPGLGFIDFEILPHYQDEMFEKVKNFYNGSKLYLLKDGEAITVMDGKMKVLGEERVI